MYEAKRVFIFVPGIRQGDISGVNSWADRAVRWVPRNVPGDAIADRYEYCSTASLRWLKQRERIENLSCLMREYADREITLVCHSNGCELAVQALKNDKLRVRSLHFFAAAANADFEKNGLNKAISEARVGELHLYGSRNDWVLEVGGWTGKGLGWIGLGYGELGRVGAKKISDAAKAVTRQIWRDNYGHSSWFTEENLGETLRMACELENA